MMQWMVLWFAAAILFLAIDMTWLLWLGRSLYVSEIGAILRQPPNLVAAAAELRGDPRDIDLIGRRARDQAHAF